MATKTENPMIYQKMTEIFNDIEFIGKNKKNQQQGYNFRGIDDMYNELHNLFAKHQVFLSSEVLNISREERLTKSGNNLLYTILTVKISFFTTDGSSVSSVCIGEAMDSADKSANKAMSAALKYALMQTFLIPTEELKDADLTTPENSVPKVPEAPKQPEVKWMTAKQFETVKKLLSSVDNEEVKKGIANFEAFQKDPYQMTKEQQFELQKLIDTF